MQIDFRKSWAWAVDQDSKDAWKTIVEHCAQTNKHFKLVLEAKDLGEQMLYSRAHRIGVHRDRLGKADKKIQKLFRRGSDLGTVAMVIQTNIWPTALHSADLQYLGKDHFHALRAKASQALAGKCEATSSWLSCHFLHHTLQDPGLYVLAKAATQVRKRAVFDMPFARSFVLRASQPCPGVPRGPASSFGKYLVNAGGSIDPDGNITSSCGHNCNVLRDPPKVIKRKLTDLWTLKVQSEVAHRKGVPPDFNWDRNLTIKTFQEFLGWEQRVLAPYLVGAIAVNAATAKAGQDAHRLCEVCGQIGTHDHRFFTCEVCEPFKQEHPDIFAFVRMQRPRWVFFPMAYQHKDTSDLFQVWRTRAAPEPVRPTAVPFLRFYTDGSCLNPSIPTARRAGWAIVQDTSQTDEERLSCLARLHDHQHLPECMRVMCTSLTDQDQTINRSEVRAVCQALRSSLLVEFRHCDIFSDSQYACNCVAKYCVGKRPAGSQPNSDILTEMQAIWTPDRHRLKWVRAHRRLSEARDLVEAWDILGNRLVDFAAGSALQTEQPIVVATVNALAGHIEQEAKMHDLHQSCQS